MGRVLDVHQPLILQPQAHLSIGVEIRVVRWHVHVQALCFVFSEEVIRLSEVGGIGNLVMAVFGDELQVPGVTEDDDDDANNGQQDDDGCQGHQRRPRVVHPPEVGLGDLRPVDDRVAVRQADVVHVLVQRFANDGGDVVLTVFAQNPAQRTDLFKSTCTL
eukprot:TRINITY_DN84561_c0_g1_i3.p1 TRINITY_DN84561_c0_g1~~TRINITY_DN84561_c0_g1_i3.p1  ORF type:complete len:161 (+),score=30.81 TRINITY_DN84561_c0_g1_i3:241-723(+)